MHEYTIAKNLAYLIFKEIKEKKPKKIKKIVFVVGEASGVDCDFLEHSLRDHIFKNTICEYAKLVFKKEKPRIKCKNCKCEFKEPVYRCSCGSTDFEIEAGKDVFIEEIDLE